MFKIQPIHVGSKGNALVIKTASANFLLDCGVDIALMKQWGFKNKRKLSDIKQALLTHSHNDHIKSAYSMYSDYGTKIYTSQETWEISGFKLKEIPNIHKNILKAGKITKIEDCKIMPFNVNHGNSNVHRFHEAHGYLIQNDMFEQLVYLTDVGSNPPLVKNANVYIIEANNIFEDVENASIKGTIPQVVANRVLSINGHLMVDKTTEYLNKCIGDKTELIIVTHISQSANVEKLKKEFYKDFNGKQKVVFLESGKILSEEYIVGYEKTKINF